MTTTMAAKASFYAQSGVIVRDSVAEDIDALKDTMRESDVREIKASHGHTPEQALRYSFADSAMCFTVEDKGKAVAMFGVVPETLLGYRGSVWLLASEGFKELEFRFLRHSRYFIERMLEEYPVLYNYADIRNVRSIAWLKWCGAYFFPARTYGVEQRLFQFFVLRRGGFERV